ncbi:MFS transporter [Aspergillus mulundensis]|uniref:Putative MFS-type transporter C18.02 n=1 Tax=Aspergillus mulundensis TaxID=1810919 RepID=A0A3D8RY41_9EURO|nr:putative MFS-type transporter C18.02 [Aspergillus mulundensis]RDW78928.1 putative MFS-type transporter C18.02 [Aspergillus mulundensis]
MVSSVSSDNSSTLASPVAHEFRASTGFITFVVTLAAFTDSFLYGLIVPVTPTALEQRVGIAPEDVQRWVAILLALDGLAWLMTSPITGYLADRVQSRQSVLLAGLPALVVSTGLLWVGNSVMLWALGRILQGASAAVTWTVGLALLTDTVDKERLGESLGYMSMGTMAGTTAGPLLGGIIYQLGGYHAVFGAVIALIAVDAILRLAMVEKRETGTHKDRSGDDEQRQARAEASDSDPLLRGAGSSSSNYGALRSPAVDDGEDFDPPPQRAAMLVLLSTPKILLSLWAYLAVSMTFTSLDSVGQGLVFLPLSITQIIDPLVGRICDKYPRARRGIASAAFLCAAGACNALRIVTHDSSAQKVALCVLLAALGVSLSFAVSPILLSIDETLDAIEQKDPGSLGAGGAVAQAYGLVNCAFAGGALVGPMLGGLVRSMAGWGTLGGVVGLIHAVTAVGLWVLDQDQQVVVVVVVIFNAPGIARRTPIVPDLP